MSRIRRHRRARALLVGSATALALTGSLTPATPAAADGPPVARVSPRSAQTVDNIGASGAWWGNDVGRFSPAVRAQAARLLFSRDGLALSAYRYNIGGGGTGTTFVLGRRG